MIALPLQNDVNNKNGKFLFIVKNNGFPLQMIQNLRNKIMHKTHKNETAATQRQQKK
jgi:hypothetical protein